MKVRVPLPESFVFGVELDVRVDDVNYGGHLGNDAVLRLVHEARLRYLATHGADERSFGDGALIMRDAAVAYHAQAFHGDRLRIDLAVQDLSACGFDFVYRLTRVTDGVLIAAVKTGMACFDYENKKVVPLPEAFRLKAEG